ncbi:capZ-interacting protein isoform X1 [Hippopotamus amphibius kiboko]|uniref:capZ-interacting protein isoform X1 n=1 Tax=Hippopotamus amphibius kiboko TaxID=575201 RepID=UPI00259982C3|nr:capZ-interacting protein isoform X1 [Hippopotamus amphibius kiboko]
MGVGQWESNVSIREGSYSPPRNPRKIRARAAGAVPQPESRARSRPLALCPPQPPPARAGAQRRAGTASPGPSERARAAAAESAPGDMEERPAETNASVDDSAPPSVAQLAGRFREQAAAAKETPASKPTRRKPPCSLSLFPHKVELGQNGEEKSPPNANHPPKVKVKSSPLIEKLQANLAFDPAALLPGALPKSPGLKAVVSPFHSPPSTPSSPGVRSRASESEEVPVSFDQPPEGSHLPSYNKVRTRGSIKRRPPSRRFRRSQSDCGDLGRPRAVESSQENGAKEEDGDEVFPAKSKAPGSPPLRRTPSRTEKQEEDEGRAAGEAQQHEKAAGEAQQPEQAAGSSEEGAGQHPARASSPQAEGGCGSPTEEKPAGEQREEPTEEKERAASEEEEPRQQGQDTKGPEEGAVGEETPQNPPGGGEGDHSPEQGTGKEKQDKEAVLEPGCDPGTGHAQPDTSSEVPKTEDSTPVEDTIL